VELDEGADGASSAGARPSERGEAGAPEAWLRWAGAAGILVVALNVLALLFPEPPGGTPQEAATQLALHASGHHTAVLVELVSDLAYVVFLAATWSYLRRAEGPGGAFSAMYLVGGVLSEAVFLVSVGLHMADVQFGLSGAPGQEGLPALGVLAGWVSVSARPATAAMYLGAAAVILTTRVFPRWAGWLALAVAGALLISLVGMFVPDPLAVVVRAVDWLGWTLNMGWIVAMSVLVLVRARTRDAVAAG
jgi:hypothetical protein